MFPITRKFQAITPARGFVIGALVLAASHTLGEWLHSYFSPKTSVTRILTLFYAAFATNLVLWAGIAHGGNDMVFYSNDPNASYEATQSEGLNKLTPGVSKFWSI